MIEINLDLNKELIEKIKVEATEMIKEIMLPDLIQVILYGSCVRGDYRVDSDVDIALLTKCNRYEAKKYDKELAKIATELAMKYFAVVNFVSLPYDEFLEKKSWYSYASDYDDFYVANKEESRQQVENARYMINKVKKYLQNEFSNSDL